MNQLTFPFDPEPVYTDCVPAFSALTDDELRARGWIVLKDADEGDVWKACRTAGLFGKQKSKK